MEKYVEKGPHYEIPFTRVRTAHFEKSAVELKAYDCDIRQILADNSIKGLIEETERRLIAGLGIPPEFLGMDYCKNCHASKEAHMDGKCMYGPGTYEPFT